MTAAFFKTTACTAFAFFAVAVARGDEGLTFITNGTLRLGVRKDAGACIAHLSLRDGPNVLDAFDHGRFIQQSYYGAPDGSDWAGKPWRYNPVQGGDYKGRASTLLGFDVRDATLHSRTRPRHWATGADVPEMLMEQWAALHDDMLHLRCRMTYSGEVEHPPAHHEIPAVFVKKEYDTLVLDDGGGIRRWRPGWPNEHVRFPKHRAIWLNAEGRGVGVFVPLADEATCYRFGDGKGVSACSYIAPLAKFALKPGASFEFHAWFTLGTEAEIAARFTALEAELGKPSRPAK